MRVTIWLATLALLTGCGEDRQTAANESQPRQAEVHPANSAPPSPPTPPKPVPGIKIAQEDPTLSFAYAWPPQAAGIAPLDAWLRGNADKLRADALKTSGADAKSAKEDGFPFHQHSYEESFAVAADVPRLLVLQSAGYVFTGGAHGMPISTFVLWDKAAGKRVALSDIIDAKRMAAAATSAYCKALAVERTKKRGGEPAPIVDKDDPFNGCPALERQTIFPVSSAPGKPLDRLRVYIGPYEAGPYAEGVYEMDLPMSAAMMAAVRPEWRGAF